MKAITESGDPFKIPRRSDPSAAARLPGRLTPDPWSVPAEDRHDGYPRRMLQPGDRVLVPDDDSGEVVFVRSGDPGDGIEVDSAAATSGHFTADVGWVQYPTGDLRTFPFADIRHA
jgi:hypothetical protein